MCIIKPGQFDQKHFVKEIKREREGPADRQWREIGKLSNNLTNNFVNFVPFQIDAAINSGNSGGPALQDDKLIGIAFETLDNAENIGYIIPVSTTTALSLLSHGLNFYGSKVMEILKEEWLTSIIRAENLDPEIYSNKRQSLEFTNGSIFSPV